MTIAQRVSVSKINDEQHPLLGRGFEALTSMGSVSMRQPVITIFEYRPKLADCVISAYKLVAAFMRLADSLGRMSANTSELAASAATICKMAGNRFCAHAYLRNG